MTQETTTPTVMPRVNIIDNADTVLLEAELPGVPKDGIELEVKDGELTLIGRRAHDHADGRLCISERTRGDYARSFTLSRSIDAGKVDAAMHDGVLTITLHKVEDAKPRRIKVQ